MTYYMKMSPLSIITLSDFWNTATLIYWREVFWARSTQYRPLTSASGGVLQRIDRRGYRSPLMQTRNSRLDIGSSNPCRNSPRTYSNSALPTARISAIAR